jgi:histidyl-tRNA synthetase
MLVTMLVRFGLPAGAIEVSINSLGEPEEREAYRKKLVDYFSGHRDRLDDDSRRRLETNPLRILDSKNPDVIAVAAGAPKLIDELTAGSRARFERVRALLGALDVKHDVDPSLVRGLDYYTGTIFEIKTKAGELGAQNTVAGGGRYDRLVASLGGQPTPAIGFALGVERALLAIPDSAESYEPALAVFFAPMNDAALEFGLPIAQRLREKGIRIEVEHRPGKMGKMLGRANKLRARAAVIIGDNEIASGKLTVKDLAHGTQSEVAVADLEAKIRQLLD